MAIDRRTVLRASGVVAVSAALGAWTAGGRQQAESAPGQLDWAGLRNRLSGSLLLPQDSGYERAKLAFNPRFDDRRPAAVAKCGTVSDVQACVTAAAGTGITVAARSGSHSYAGYSTPDDGLIIDVGGLDGVEVRSDGTAVIGAGARLMPVYAGLADAGRCLPAGSCPTVGIAGLTLGGGIGVLAGKYGLTCDSLVSAEIVTADGTVRTASATSEPDLFWALRGGGGGNFGVVTSFTFRTQPAPRPAVAKLLFPAVRRRP
ncbi:FAD-binding oxidoreductase [Nocardia inohanensis]|uniref:FAD-binding oxidoreductase n=1 Tax=Nocardia inohanensis TaxID=209246 RepID=UPI000A5A7B99|nr:FAD-binding oxidoreductase [Nocardia inohanensis]